MNQGHEIPSPGRRDWMRFLENIERLTQALAPEPQHKQGVSALATAGALTLIFVWFVLAWFAGFGLAFKLASVAGQLIHWTIDTWNVLVEFFNLNGLAAELPGLRDHAGIYAGISAFGAAVVLSTLQQCAQALKEILHEFPQLHWRTLAKTWLTIFVAFFGASLAIVGIGKAQETLARIEGQTLRLTSLIVGGAVTEQPLFVMDIPFLERAGRQTILGSNSTAVTVDPAFRDILQAIGAALRDCSATDPSLTVNQGQNQIDYPVRIAMTGFTSTSEWSTALHDLQTAAHRLSNDRGTISAELYSDAARKIAAIKDTGFARTDGEAFNLWVARERADSVLAGLFPGIARGTAPAGVAVDNLSLRYPQFFLAGAQQTVDTERQEKQTNSGILTRVVRLEVLSAGRCGRRLPHRLAVQRDIEVLASAASD